MTPAERQKQYRDRLRGGPARVPAEHGSRAAIRRHERHGELIKDCEACRLERNRLAREQYRRRCA